MSVRSRLILKTSLRSNLRRRSTGNARDDRVERFPVARLVDPDRHLRAAAAVGAAQAVLVGVRACRGGLDGRVGPFLFAWAFRSFCYFRSCNVSRLAKAPAIFETCCKAFSFLSSSRSL